MAVRERFPKVEQMDECCGSSDSERETHHDSGFSSTRDPDFSKMSRKELRYWCQQRNYAADAITNEVFNWASHLLTGLTIVSLTLRLLVLSDSVTKKVGYAVYAFGNSVMLFGSTLHHAVGLGGFSIHLYRIFRMIDHCGIFVVIAGTFGPIALVFGGYLGFAVFFYLQFVMICSIVLKIITRHTLNQNVFNMVYLVMGWSALLLIKPILQCGGWPCFGVVAAGGVSYTIGIIFFQREKPNPIKGYFCSHEIWHCFVSLGVVLHYVPMHLWVFPYKSSK